MGVRVGQPARGVPQFREIRVHVGEGQQIPNRFTNLQAQAAAQASPGPLVSPCAIMSASALNLGQQGRGSADQGDRTESRQA